MKRNKILMAVAGGAIALSMVSCSGWLGEESPGVTDFEDFFIGGPQALQTVNAAYAPLAWEFNNSYFSEWYFGDIASDDALKGGQNISDGGDAYDIDNFKVNASNTICLDYYRAKFQGIARCNLALEQVPDVIAKLKEGDAVGEERLKCALGEAYFMRGMYYFQLVRVFGGVPLVTYTIDNSTQWQQPRASREEIYAQIVADFTEAEKLLWEKSKYDVTDAGRATKGAAKAYLCKAYLYMGDYDNAYKWGKDWYDNEFSKGEYSLNNDYFVNFTEAGENDKESVFEIQYMADPTSDYGEGFGFTRGTFTTILTRPRATKLGPTGWGWNHPTHNLWNEYEQGDPRREMTIGVPDAEDAANVEVNYLGSPYYNLKTSMFVNGEFPRLDHDSRSPLNYKLMRASDALLLYAEAALESGKDLAGAKHALELVRARARAQAADPAALPAFPGYNGYADNTEDMRKALRHERRVELAMEGHRWFDLVRWNIVEQTMKAYRDGESEEARKEMGNYNPVTQGLFPIPAEEINLNPMTQNPGY